MVAISLMIIRACIIVRFVALIGTFSFSLGAKLRSCSHEDRAQARSCPTKLRHEVEEENPSLSSISRSHPGNYRRAPEILDKASRRAAPIDRSRGFGFPLRDARVLHALKPLRVVGFAETQRDFVLLFRRSFLSPSLSLSPMGNESDRRNNHLD